MNIKNFVRRGVYALTAYQAKEVPCRVKLDANESPYGFDVAVKTLIKLKTHRYPDPEARALRKLVAKELSVAPENILQGNGSDELIYYLITTFGGPVLYPVPTFSMYGIIAQALGERKIEVPLDSHFDLALKEMLSTVRKEKPRLIFLSSPNNPTGNCFSAERILKVIERSASKSIVVVDEAYQPFASAKGFLPMLRDYANLVIMRTVSKIGLAGLRVGFLIASPEIIHEVNKVRLPFNLNAFSQAIACDAMKNKGLMQRNIRSVISERTKLFEGISKIEGITAYPSEANFILFKAFSADGIYEYLLKEGVLVRNMKGLIKDCLRVTVGSPAENRVFLQVLNQAVRRVSK